MRVDIGFWSKIFFLFFAYSVKVDAQITCPPNIDFESGLGNWVYQIGNCCPIVASPVAGPILNRHTWTTGTAIDPYGNFPIVSPGGGLHSLKLGNSNVNSEAEKATYTFTVPNSINNYSLIYRYAVVFEDPQHTAAMQPRFEVKAFVTGTNAIIPCSQRTYVSGSSLPGFSLSSIGSNIWFHPWTLGTLNLSGYAGQTITVEFASGDCGLGAHFGYGYVDMNCSLFQVAINNCSNSPTTPLNAPPGYQTYTWMDANYNNVIGTGQNIIINTPTVSTTYHLILTPFAGLGCIDTLTTTVNVTSLTINATPDTVLCSGNSLTLSAGVTSNQAITYLWSPASGLSCTNCSNPIASPSVNTQYQVTATNGNNCTVTDTVFIAIDSVRLTVTKQDIACNGNATGSAVAVLSGGIPPYLYSWNTVPIQQTAAINNLPVGSYIITAKDSFCTRIATINLTQPNVLIPSVTATDVTCFGVGNGTLSTVVVGGKQPYIYSWNTAPIVHTPNLTSLVPGIYTLTVMDSNNCSATYTSTISQPQKLLGQINSVSNVSCNGGANGSTTLTVSGGTMPFSVLWNTVPSQNGLTAYNLTAGTYLATISDTKGCKDTLQAIIMQPPPLNVATPIVQNLTCINSGNGSILITPTGGTPPYAFSWNTSPVQHTSKASNLPAGTYSCTITDANGCSIVSTATINYPNPLQASISTPQVINCFGDSTGSATVNVNGGFSPYTYIWSTQPSVFTKVASGLKAGNYSVTVTDSVGCTTVATVSLQQNPPLQLSTTCSKTCVGQKQGSATVSISGGIAGYSIIWNSFPQQTGITASNLQAGIITVKVTDSKGCSNSTKVIIDTFPKLSIKVRNDTILCYGSPVLLYALGASVYSWSPTASLSCGNCANPFANPENTTTYWVVGTDNNNCKDTNQVVITVLKKIPISLEPVPDICQGESVQFQAHGGVAYNWQPKNGLDNYSIPNPIASPSSTTVYTVFIKENDCFSDTLLQKVVVEPYPTINLGADLHTVIGNPLYLKADTAHAISIRWTPATGLTCDQCADPIANVERTITYTAEAKNRLGCTTTDDLIISVGCSNATIYLPNTFTPNGDGLNDVYFPKGLGVEKVNDFSIYNRWGELLYRAQNFQVNDPKYGWDGVYKSEPMKADVYVYMVNATCVDGEHILLKGDVTLYR
ncbi:MAG: gliding motility-associated C-terminal domain-containing protein [Bacteroidetes bacterium]|nr:gliding motility-associated C-terminal domain-containing protein [Bacteroidota bacterium]